MARITAPFYSIASVDLLYKPALCGTGQLPTAQRGLVSDRRQAINQSASYGSSREEHLNQTGLY